MLGGGLVFVYDLLPLVAAFLFARRLPEVFQRARLKMSERTLRMVSAVGIGVLLVQGSLSFSDIDRGGWGLVVAYVAATAVYIRYRAPFVARAEGRSSFDG
jgi:hypothetical protein